MDDDVLKLRDQWYARAKEQTLETLPAFMAELADHKHDYNTICYALAAAAQASAWAMNGTPNGGITGFQAGAVMWEFMRGWNGVEFPAKLLDYNNLLYPQYEETFTQISRDTWEHVQKRAREHLEQKTSAVASVRDHWKSIAAGNVPFGLSVESA